MPLSKQVTNDYQPVSKIHSQSNIINELDEKGATQIVPLMLIVDMKFLLAFRTHTGFFHFRSHSPLFITAVKAQTSQNIRGHA